MISGPASNKKRFAASDIWSFFDKEGSSKVCKFCKYVFRIFLFLYTKIITRAMTNVDDPDHRVSTFGSRMSTGTLRRHFITNHLSDWVSECDKLGIVIKSREALGAIAELHGKKAEKAVQHRIPFSNEAFIDALVDLIVVNDLVSSH